MDLDNSDRLHVGGLISDPSCRQTVPLSTCATLNQVVAGNGSDVVIVAMKEKSQS